MSQQLLIVDGSVLTVRTQGHPGTLSKNGYPTHTPLPGLHQLLSYTEEVGEKGVSHVCLYPSVYNFYCLDVLPFSDPKD